MPAGGAKDKAVKGEAESKSGADAKKTSKKKEAPAPKPLTPWEQLRKNVERLVKAVTEADDRAIHKVIRQNTAVRKQLTAANLARAVEGFLPNDTAAPVLALIGPIAAAEAEAAAAAGTDDVDMTADDGAAGAGAGAGAGEEGAGEGGEKDGDTEMAPAEAEKPLKESSLPEVAAYFHLLAQSALFKYNLVDKAAESAVALVAYLKQFNRRTLDQFGAKAYAALSLSAEKLGRLSSVRGELMLAHRTACLRHDEMGRATLLNLLLRNYLHYNLFDQANKLKLRATFPEAVSNNQFVRYLYYSGRIAAVRLDYSDALMCLQQASRKAPSATAGGFRATVQRLLVVVQLLMGEVPDRSLFTEKGLRVALKPHFKLTQAVRVGDLAMFNSAVAEFADDFKRDGTWSLIARLRHNVIKAGLRKIAVSYSCISFADIAAKLQLGTPEDAEFLAAKAIKDGVIDAYLDHDAGALHSKDTVDIYATTEPQQAFHKRISFCLDVHNEAVKGMVYAPNAHKPKRAKKKKDEPTEEEEAAAIEEEEDDE